MIAAIIKSAILLVIAACVASRLKRQSAAVRHTVWTAGLAGAMAIPLCTLTLPPWQTTFAAPAIEFFQNTVGSLDVLRQAAIGVWIVGASAGIALLLYSAGRLAWVAIGAEPVEDDRWGSLAEDVRRRLGIRRPVRLLQNRSVPFLGTWGILVPRVLLPRDAESWPDDRIRMVLAHELAHIQRHDWVVQVLADAARAIYWFNPIFWLASSRLRRESEHACDDAVVRLGAAGPRYAEELLAMTRALRSDRSMQSPILAMAQPSHLEQRLVALLNPSLNRLAATPWAVIVVAAVAIALTLPLAAVRTEETIPRSEAVPTPVISMPMPQPEPVVPTVAGNNARSPSRRVPSESLKTSSTIASAVAEAAAEEPAESTEASTPLFATTEPVADTAPAAPAPEPPPFECKVTTSVLQTKTRTIEKMALGNGPWIINDDRTLWATDQPYIANRLVNTVWIRPANTELKLTARRLDGAAGEFSVGPAAPYQTGYIAIGVVFPTGGCWEVNAIAGDSKLTFITKVRE